VVPWFVGGIGSDCALLLAYFIDLASKFAPLGERFDVDGH